MPITHTWHSDDVVRYAITLVEVFTDGALPYANMQNNEVMAEVPAGYKLSRPRGCPPEVYKLLLECWAMDPALRPDFSTVIRRIEDIESNFEAGGSPYGSRLWTAPGSGTEFHLTSADEEVITDEEIEFLSSAQSQNDDDADHVCKQCGHHNLVGNNNDKHKKQSLQATPSHVNNTVMAMNDQEMVDMWEPLVTQSNDKHESSAANAAKSLYNVPIDCSVPSSGDDGSSPLYVPLQTTTLERNAADSLYVVPVTTNGSSLVDQASKLEHTEDSGGSADSLSINPRYADDTSVGNSPRTPAHTLLDDAGDNEDDAFYSLA